VGVRFLKSIALFVAIVIVLLALPLLFVDWQERDVAPPAGSPPWQIEPEADGNTRVFGLMPGVSTLAAAGARLGPELSIALLVAPGENGSVEAYLDSFVAGGVSGKLILTLETTPEQRERMLARAVKAEYMNSTTRRIELAAEDVAQLQPARVLALTFIPSANLSAAVAVQRFGAPAERIRGAGQTEHFLYPAQGLDLRLDAEGKEVLQYVAPRDFARLRDPLLSLPQN